MQITCQKFRWDYWSLTSSGDVREPQGTSRKARLQLRTPAPRGCCHRQGRAPRCEASRSLRLVRAALRCENAPTPHLQSPPFQSSVPPWKARPKGQQRREAPSGAAAGTGSFWRRGAWRCRRRAGSVTATSSRFYVAVPDGIRIDPDALSPPLLTLHLPVESSC